MGKTIINFRNFGVTVRRMKDGNDKWWLCFVIWYRNGRKSLGYRYPSIKWFELRHGAVCCPIAKPM